MKTVIAVVALMSVLFVPIAQAEPAHVAALLVGYVIGVQKDKPTSYNLTDACQAKTVKAENGNYFFTSYEHCVK